MKNHWMSQSTDQDSVVRLYVTSTAELIATDLALPESASLVVSGRQLTNRRGSSDDSDHVDVAVGALTTVADGRGIGITELQPIEAIPDGLEEVWVGGDGHTFLARVFVE